MPYQLTLGGRDGVRSLLEDDLPGGRMVRAVLEDRIALPIPRWDALDLGVTLFADAGRIWAGDVPYGVTSGWEGALGAGLRVALPSGSRNAWRADVVFPVDLAGEGPVFRITMELNRIRSGFFTGELARSRRFSAGPESF
jgi:hemolysin activation/secretion protein